MDELYSKWITRRPRWSTTEVNLPASSGSGGQILEECVFLCVFFLDTVFLFRFQSIYSFCLFHLLCSSSPFFSEYLRFIFISGTFVFILCIMTMAGFLRVDNDVRWSTRRFYGRIACCTKTQNRREIRISSSSASPLANGRNKTTRRRPSRRQRCVCLMRELDEVRYNVGPRFIQPFFFLSR